MAYLFISILETGFSITFGSTFLNFRNFDNARIILMQILAHFILIDKLHSYRATKNAFALDVYAL